MKVYLMAYRQSIEGRVPPNITLAAGMTATVIVTPKSQEAKSPWAAIRDKFATSWTAIHDKFAMLLRRL
jgi:hypothetical protein